MAKSTSIDRASTNGAAVDGPAAPLQTIQLEALQIQTVLVPIVGITPLIPHRWAEKALRMMREKHSGKSVRTKKDPKIPEEEAEAATYRLPGGAPGMPATAFKAALVDAVRFFDGITMTQAKVSFFVEGVGPEQLVEIHSPEPPMLREDTPRNATGVADLRYRFAYDPWSSVLPITFVANMLNLESLLALVDAAGSGGVGDWRPSAPKSKTGTFGRFQTDMDGGIQVVGRPKPSGGSPGTAVAA